LIEDEVQERYRLAPREHAQLILPMIDELMNEAGLKPTALDAVAFGRGPGAFTGLRIAASVIQGIAFAADLPVVPVSSLAAIAQGARREKGIRRVLAAIDARIHQVYWGAYERGESGDMQVCGEESVCAPAQVPIPHGDGWQGAGTGWGTYLMELQQRLPGLVSGFDAERYPRAQDIALLGVAGFRNGEAVGADYALPVYLRDEVALKQR
jgi:tRNA threonylcarbamoyladenosine biosynthesis protein TsaB